MKTPCKTRHTHKLILTFVLTFILTLVFIFVLVLVLVLVLVVILTFVVLTCTETLMMTLFVGVSLSRNHRVQESRACLSNEAQKQEQDEVNGN